MKIWPEIGFLLGIEKIHQLGGKVNLAYGGQYQGVQYQASYSQKFGISSENGGGSRNTDEDRASADHLAQRIAKSVGKYRF